MYIELKAGRRSLLLDEKLFALSIVPILFMLITGLFFKFSFLSLVWASIYLVSFIWFSLDYRLTCGLIWKWRILFILPAIAVLSVLWSTHPSRTLVAAIQFTFSTLLAIRLAEALETRVIISALMFATLTGALLSLMSVFVPAFSPTNENNGAFIGIYIQKTVAGVSFALAALTLVSIGKNRQYLLIRSLFALSMAPLILITDSVSALIVFGFVPIVIALKFMAHKSTTFHVTTLMGILIATLAIGLTFWLDSFDVMTWFLQLVGKNPTLTGRTYIWEVGLEVWRDNPVLGVGFRAFWENPNFSELVGFLHATVDPRLKGFHNIYIESLVTTGLVGTIAMMTIYVWTFFRCFFWHVATGTSESIFWVAITLIGLAFSLTDNALFAEHEKFHILFTMAFVFAAQRPEIRLPMRQ